MRKFFTFVLATLVLSFLSMLYAPVSAAAQQLETRPTEETCEPGVHSNSDEFNSNDVHLDNTLQKASEEEVEVYVYMFDSIPEDEPVNVTAEYFKQGCDWVDSGQIESNILAIFATIDQSEIAYVWGSEYDGYFSDHFDEFDNIVKSNFFDGNYVLGITDAVEVLIEDQSTNIPFIIFSIFLAAIVLVAFLVLMLDVY